MKARFLVGMLAALASKTGKVGFVGGMDIPLIRKFACGYEQGVKYANPKAEVIQNMTGTTPAAWNDPARGGELAKGQFDRGADVVYAAAGGTGIGVLQAAKDAGKLGDRRRLQPEPPASRHDADLDDQARRRRGLQQLQDAKDGTWKAGIAVLGLKEGGVGWALDENNEKLITPEMKAKVDAGQGRHHRRQDQGARLHERQRLHDAVGA